MAIGTYNRENSSLPSLAKVMFVESRHSVRVNSLETLKECNLFSDVVVPMSLNDGLERLSAEKFDACVIGSSVKRDNAAVFLARAMAKSQEAQCAFVVLAKEGDEAILMPGVHQTCAYPTDVNALSQALIFGVVKANPEGAWAQAIEKTPEGALVEFSVRIEKEEEREMRSAFLGLSLSDLEEIVQRFDRGELALGPNRTPSRASEAALAAVVKKAFGAEFRSRKVLEFKEFFAASLRVWFIDLAEKGVGPATENLRGNLHSFGKL